MTSGNELDDWVAATAPDLVGPIVSVDGVQVIGLRVPKAARRLLRSSRNFRSATDWGSTARTGYCRAGGQAK